MSDLSQISIQSVIRFHVWRASDLISSRQNWHQQKKMNTGEKLGRTTDSIIKPTWTNKALYLLYFMFRAHFLPSELRFLALLFLLRNLGCEPMYSTFLLSLEIWSHSSNADSNEPQKPLNSWSSRGKRTWQVCWVSPADGSLYGTPVACILYSLKWKSLQVYGLRGNSG